VFGGVFLLSAGEGKHYKNCGRGVCGNMCVGSTSALASGIFRKRSSDISGGCGFRYKFCMVGFSALRAGQLDWMAVDAGNYQAYGSMRTRRLKLRWCYGATLKYRSGVCFVFPCPIVSGGIEFYQVKFAQI